MSKKLLLLFAIIISLFVIIISILINEGNSDINYLLISYGLPLFYILSSLSLVWFLIGKR